MRPQINFITLGVADLKAARKFYEKGLGWPASSASQDTIVFFKIGGLILSLYPRGLLAQDATVKSRGSGFRGITLGHNVQKKEQVAETLKLAQAAGAKIVKPAQDVFWGGHSGYFADLDGQLWEVAWHPHFKLNKRGELELP